MKKKHLKKITYRNLENINYDQLSFRIQEKLYHPDLFSMNINEITNHYNNCMKIIYEKFAPKTTKLFIRN